MRKRNLQHYTIERKLGEGAHGVVYLARDRRLFRPVVIKMLRRGLFSFERQRERILREARLASAIDHPNVCSIYEIHDEPGQVFIAMQYVAGRPLRELMAEGRLSVPLTLSIATQIAEGLAAAHELGVIHRDLKPANIVVSDAGLVKILDFGLARREAAASGDAPASAASGESADDAPADAPTPSASASGPAGTAGYMAPEQFVGDPATPQSDLFSVGVNLYMMLTGEHPFGTTRADAVEIARAAQFQKPPPPSSRRPEVPQAVDSVVAKALAKDPAERYQSASELRNALGALETERDQTAALGVPRVAPAALSAPRKSGLRSLLRGFFPDPRSSPTPGTVAVLPFEDRDHLERVTTYGFALANAIATKLARLPGISVRSTPSLLSLRELPAEPAEAGERLGVSHAVSGTYAREEGGFAIAWQLVEVAHDTVLAGDTRFLSSLDFVEAQTHVSEQVYSALRGASQIPLGGAARREADPPPEVAESYFEARALLSTFLMRSHRRKDLDAAREKLRAVAEAAPSFAPVHAALGVVHVQYARSGFGTIDCIKAASSALERALELDPDHAEAKVFRAYALLSLGEKTSAREGARHLLEVAPDDSNVRLLAATLLRLDGAYGEALAQLSENLRRNPDDAHLVYNQRARLFHYRGELESARVEIDKALELQPRHPLLRATDGYLRLRAGDPHGAIGALEAVVEDHPTLQLAYPTLAMAKWRVGETASARALISEPTLAAADCDGETAYRVATFFATTEERDAALRWLRRSIHLGNENYPWLSANPAWSPLFDDEDFRAVLERLEARHRRNLDHWRRLLPA